MSPIDGALLVSERRRALFEPSLGMKCDGKEVPAPYGGGEAVGWWIAGKALFAGHAARAVEDGQLIEPEKASIEGTATVVVTAERVIGIVSPDDYSVPALWWSWGLESIKVTTEGRQRLFRQRPKIVAVDRHGAGVDLGVVSKLNRGSGRHRPGQERPLLAALENR